MNIKLLSSEAVYTPNIIRLVMQLANEGKLKVADKILAGYNLKKSVRAGVMDGSIRWRIEGESVILMVK